MMTSAVLRSLNVRPGREIEATDLLIQVRRLANREPQSMGSHLIQLDDGAFATLDLFADELSRRQHLAGAAAQAISYRTRDLFDPEPLVELLDVEARSIPETGACWIRLRRTDGAITTLEWEPVIPDGVPTGRLVGEVVDLATASHLTSA